MENKNDKEVEISNRTSHEVYKDSPDSPDECSSVTNQDGDVLKAKESNFVKPNVFADSSFIMWENNSNICWLDASMALLVHNQTMRHVIKMNPDSQVSKIIKCYDSAISTLNDFISDQSTEDRLKNAKEILEKVQESSMKYLQPFIKFKKGEPDSAFCSLLNLIKEDKLIQGFFDVTYAWVRLCDNCEMQRVLTATKPIITIANVNNFVPENLFSPFQCPSCKKKDQKMKLIYKKLPACLIFHFENGAGDGDILPIKFLVASREYQLTGVMMLEKGQESNVNHFVTYIRDPSVNKWLECNDLNTEIVSFSESQPEFNLKDVYIYVYETFDELGTIEIDEDPSLRNSNHNIPCIDLSDEEDPKKASPNKNPKEPEIEQSDAGETVEKIQAFLSASFKENSNSNTNTTTEVVQKDLNSTKKSEGGLSSENSIEVSKHCASSSSVTASISNETCISKLVKQAIPPEAPKEQRMFKKKTVKTPVDGYFNIEKFIEDKLNEIKAAPKLGSTYSIGFNTNILKKNTENIGSQENEKSSQVYGSVSDRFSAKDRETKVTKYEENDKVDASVPNVKTLQKLSQKKVKVEVAKNLQEKELTPDKKLTMKPKENGKVNRSDSQEKYSSVKQLQDFQKKVQLEEDEVMQEKMQTVNQKQLLKPKLLSREEKHIFLNEVIPKNSELLSKDIDSKHTYAHNLTIKHKENGKVVNRSDSQEKSSIVKQVQNIPQKNAHLEVGEDTQIKEQSVNQQLFLNPKFESREEKHIISNEIIPKNSELLSKDSDSKQVSYTHSKNIETSLINYAPNVSVPEDTQHDLSPKKYFEQMEQHKKEFKKQTNPRKTIKSILESREGSDLKEEIISASTETLNESKRVASDKKELLRSLKETWEDSVFSSLSFSDKSAIRKQMPTILSANATAANDEMSSHISEPSCSYSVTSPSSKGFKSNKHKVFPQVQFSKNGSNHRNEEIKSNEIAKNAESKVSKYFENSIIDDQENASDMLSSNCRTASNSSRISKLKRKKGILKVKIISPSKAKRNKEKVEDENDTSVGDKSDENIISEEDSYFLSPPMKKTKTENLDMSIICPTFSSAANPVNEFYENASNNSQHSSCLKPNCQCYKMKKRVILDGTIDYFLMKMFQTFPLKHH